MAVGIMTTIRFRLPFLWPTIFLDGAGLWFLGEHIALSIFVISELFYRLWDAERARGQKMRDIEASKFYELEQLQGDLMIAATQIERMTSVSERALIAREIHDNAGHEIVGASISLQSARELLEELVIENNLKQESEAALELYDEALERLDKGVGKIREAVHNLAPITALGIESLQETCDRFSACEIKFNVFGDTSTIPMYCWNLFEACLNESLTNVMRHSDAKQVKVDLDATPNIIRLSVENDGVKSKGNDIGIGLRNLRHRAAAVGGNIAVDVGETFRVICVVHVKEK
jgi:signal transduction histidine kinase